VEVRELQPGDVDAMLAFFERVPAGERAFFKEEVLDRACVESWVRDDRAWRALAVDGDEVAGYIAMIPGHGWSDHVAEVRLVVDPARRRGGIGRDLARRALVHAAQAGFRKLLVEVVAEQEGAVAMFQALGYTAEGLLVDQVRDHDGHLRDLVLLAHRVDDNWSAMATAGIDDAVG
jgi:ribosomal protein S18 acetylase RimI-like enzyme